VLFIDLDGFKQINDSLGHEVGDKLLQSVAGRLSGCVRSSDTISRQGGDEFIALLAEVERAEDAAASATRMLRAVAAPHEIDGQILHVTTSIGVAIYPEDGVDVPSLIKHADAAMYQAKNNGKQSVELFQPFENAVAAQ
jgi:diguanylate cyclase (GGDEF)-like protein